MTDQRAAIGEKFEVDGLSVEVLEAERRRWAHLARRGSPRYLVYSAACRLLFELPRPEGEGSDGIHEGEGWEGLWEDLPVIRPWANQRRACPWQEAASEITWRTRSFGTTTSSSWAPAHESLAKSAPLVSTVGSLESPASRLPDPR